MLELLLLLLPLAVGQWLAHLEPYYGFSHRAGSVSRKINYGGATIGPMKLNLLITVLLNLWEACFKIISSLSLFNLNDSLIKVLPQPQNSP